MTGVSEGCFESQEWLDYLNKYNMKDEDGKVSITSSLEEFFV